MRAGARFIRDKVRFLAEAFRVLRPPLSGGAGGRLLLDNSIVTTGDQHGVFSKTPIALSGAARATGRLSALFSLPNRESGFVYGAFVRARGVLHGVGRRLPAPGGSRRASFL